MCRKGHIALVSLHSLGNWIAHDGAEKNLERGVSASGLNASHRYSFQGSKDLSKQMLSKTWAFEEVAHDSSPSRNTHSDGDITGRRAKLEK